MPAPTRLEHRPQEIVGRRLGQAGRARYRQIAALCIAAGVDKTLIERWVAVGRERAAAAAATLDVGLPRASTDPIVRLREPSGQDRGVLVDTGCCRCCRARDAEFYSMISDCRRAR